MKYDCIFRYTLIYIDCWLLSTSNSCKPTTIVHAFISLDCRFYDNSHIINDSKLLVHGIFLPLLFKTNITIGIGENH